MAGTSCRLLGCVYGGSQERQGYPAMDFSTQTSREAVHRELMAKGLARGVPSTTLQSLVNFVIHGVPPGSFAKALLENDLRGVFMRGDEENLLALRATMLFLYNDMPQVGSVQGWLEFLSSVGALS